MPDELVFTIDGAQATPADPISLSEAGLRERTHLQEWVLRHPEMLGPDVRVITFECGQWESYGGTRERDRLDVLGLDSSGRLVIGELKRDTAPEPTALQAIKYAAMASRFAIADLARQHAAFLRGQGEERGDHEAEEMLRQHTGYQLDTETIAKPRIVLMASAFRPTLTAMAVWLTEMGLDITLQRFQAYRARDRRC